MPFDNKIDKRSTFVQFLSLPALPGSLLYLDFAPQPAVGLDQNYFCPIFYAWSRSHPQGHRLVSMKIDPAIGKA